MGRKYASIHINGDDQKKILEMIEANYFDKVKDLLKERFFNELKKEDPEAYKYMIKHPSYGFSKILIIKSDTFISIYDESNSFETIQNKVKTLSSNIDYPILYTSNFDDDVFLIGAYKSGKLITSGKMGEGLSEYGMKPKNINIDKLCNTVQLEKTEAIGAINSMEEIEEIEQVVELYLHIPLDLDFDSVESDTSYVETLSNNRFHVFNKK